RCAFVGNSGVLSTGASLGDGSLVGVLSIAPSEPDAAARSGASWLGSPPIALPRREAGPTFPDARTYLPPRRLQWSRGAFEVLRITLPPAGFIFVMSPLLTVGVAIAGRFGLVSMLALLPLVYAAACATVLAGVWAAKWIVMGRYRPFERPLWCWFV